jgi:hypothetical protein
LAWLILAWGAAASWAADEQFLEVIDARAKTLSAALPGPVRYASADWDQAVLAARRISVEDANPRAVDFGLKWIKRVLKPARLPRGGLSAGSLVLVRGEAGQPDVARATWQHGGYELRVSQVEAIVVIKVTPPRGTNTDATLSEKVSFVQRVCGQLFADQDLRYALPEGSGFKQVAVRDLARKISEYSFHRVNIKVFPDGIVGVPVTREQAGVKYPGTREKIDAQDRADNPNWDETTSSWSYWWRHVSWWHDGPTIGFFFAKHEAGMVRLHNFWAGHLDWLSARP